MPGTMAPTIKHTTVVAIVIAIWRIRHILISVDGHVTHSERTPTLRIIDIKD